jgi:hypothetical protein
MARYNMRIKRERRTPPTAKADRSMRVIPLAEKIVALCETEADVKVREAALKIVKTINVPAWNARASAAPERVEPK